MKKTINLQKSTYQAAKVAVKKGNLFGSEKIKELSTLSFEEILKFLEENGFKDSIDKNYLEFEGFYLIEKIINNHLSKIYSSIFRSSSVQNKKLLELYYLKYQIHNILAVLRCKKAEESDISPYLLGDSHRQEKYFKAFEMPVEDALVYMLKKIGFDSAKGLEKYIQGDLFELENFLYSSYYSQLNNTSFYYNKKDEMNFFKFIRKYIDLINIRTFTKLKVESNQNLSFEELFIKGGFLKLDYFSNLIEKEVSEALKEFSKQYTKIEVNNPTSIDNQINILKNSSQKIFNNVAFGSPFYTLKFLFQAEQEMSQLRTLLKAKYLKLSSEEINELLY